VDDTLFMDSTSITPPTPPTAVTDSSGDSPFLKRFFDFYRLLTGIQVTERDAEEIVDEGRA